MQINTQVTFALCVVGTVAITQFERELCHKGVRNRAGRQCHAYMTAKPKETSPGKPVEENYGALDDACTTVTWWNASKDNNWGNCVNYTIGEDPKDGNEYRYFTSNSVPPYYFNPYCPFGLHMTCANDTKTKYCGGYCIADEPCPFPDLKCGVTKSTGFTTFGDVWVPMVAYTKVPKEGNPTRQDRPGDMYEVVDNGAKTVMATTAVHLNGNSIQGPNDAGAISVDVAGFQLMCGGHVTPPVTAGAFAEDSGVPAMPPMYHYHKAPDCTPEFLNHSIPEDHQGTAKKHGLLFGYALDGFGIYGYEDLGGVAPVLDECGGHFGPVDDDVLDVILYHYHATTYTPYHLACQGPALGRCEATQHGASFCGQGCGSEVCVQPGTKKSDLQKYVSQWNSTWLSHYTTNLKGESDILV